MNKSIIGNNNQRRKPANLTDRILDEANSYKNPLPKLDSKTRTSEEMKHYDAFGCLSLKLTPLEDTYVQPIFQKGYDTLMQVYEAGGWTWKSGLKPTSLGATPLSKRGKPIIAKDKFSYIEGVSGGEIIEDFEFYKKQGLTRSILEEINEWFDINKPNRESKRE